MLLQKDLFFSFFFAGDRRSRKGNKDWNGKRIGERMKDGKETVREGQNREKKKSQRGEKRKRG